MHRLAGIFSSKEDKTAREPGRGQNHSIWGNRCLTALVAPRAMKHSPAPSARVRAPLPQHLMPPRAHPGASWRTHEGNSAREPNPRGVSPLHGQKRTAYSGLPTPGPARGVWLPSGSQGVGVRGWISAPRGSVGLGPRQTNPGVSIWLQASWESLAGALTHPAPAEEERRPSLRGDHQRHVWGGCPTSLHGPLWIGNTTTLARLSSHRACPTSGAKLHRMGVASGPCPGAVRSNGGRARLSRLPYNPIPPLGKVVSDRISGARWTG